MEIIDVQLTLYLNTIFMLLSYVKGYVHWGTYDAVCSILQVIFFCSIFLFI